MDRTPVLRCLRVALHCVCCLLVQSCCVFAPSTFLFCKDALLIVATHCDCAALHRKVFQSRNDFFDIRRLQGVFVFQDWVMSLLWLLLRCLSPLLRDLSFGVDAFVGKFLLKDFARNRSIEHQRSFAC